MNGENSDKTNVVDLRKKSKNKTEVVESSLEDGITNIGFRPSKADADWPLPLPQIVDSIQKIPGFIKVNGEIYYCKNHHAYPINSAGALTGAIQMAGKLIFYKREEGFASKLETYEGFMLSKDTHDAISYVPTYPKCDRTYYLCDYVEPCETGALDQLVAFFNPKTAHDQALIKALFVSPAWSAGFGQKPIFLIQSDPDGETKVNVGKTTLAQIVAKIYGGSISLNANMDSEQVGKTTAKNRTKRVVIYDNVKRTNWSNDYLEFMVTAETIQGHLMYVGAINFANHFTYIITVNDPSVSPDLASRAVPITLCKPTIQNARWSHEIDEFVKNNLDRLYSDIGYILTQEKIERDAMTRFPVWESVILNKITNEQNLKEHIAESQKSVNADTDTGFEEYVLFELAKCYTEHNVKLSYNMSPQHCNWWISSQALQSMYRDFTGLKHLRFTSAFGRKIADEVAKFSSWTAEKGRLRMGRSVLPQGYFLTPKQPPIENAGCSYVVLEPPAENHLVRVHI